MSEPSPEQVEALAEVIASRSLEPRPPFPHERVLAARILASDWLAAMLAERERALRDRIETVLTARAGDGKFVIIGGVRAALTTPPPPPRRTNDVA